MSVRELRTLIHLAGLSSRGLLEKPEFLARAKEAKAILDARPKIPPDAQRYSDLEVQFFGRLGCPYCVQAIELLKERGLPQPAAAAASGSLPPVGTMLDVERSSEAAAEFQRALAASSSGGSQSGGVPLFFSPKTKKSAAGWRPGATDLDWLADALG